MKRNSGTEANSAKGRYAFDGNIQDAFIGLEY
jgi:hypothetical protein